MNQLKLENDINDAIYELLETKNGTSVEKVVVEISTIKFKPLNVDEIFNEVYVKPVDSTYDRISPKEILITDSTPGKKLDRDALNNIVSRINKGENVIFEELPILDVEPEITREFLESTLVNYTIATSSNKNNNNDDMTDPARMEDRANNIQKCVDALNRYILFPGEEFNFWEALGTFNESTGYVYAFDNSAAAEQKVLGGGISQVASALYLAAFTSELEIVEHHNYPYTVNYGPLGFDAHVVKGSKNLIFKNTLEFPIRIVCSYEDETIKVEILGTDTNSNVRIRTSSTTKAISYDTEYIDDPNLPEGTEFITKGGIMGYEVQLFKRIIMNGVELLSEHIGTVVYQPRNQVITRGTGQIEDIEE
jgi:vancomycin resistance protein YoaR